MMTFQSPAYNSNHKFGHTKSASYGSPRTLAPYISPASPATIATTISSSHSTPSPSPSRINMPNTAGNNDFTLFDDAIMAVAQDLNGSSAKGSAATEAPSLNYASGFPIIVPHDAPPYSNYAPYNYSSNIYSRQQPPPPPQQQQQQPVSNKYLRPYSNQKSPVESIENVPALSPTSKSHNRPRSPAEAYSSTYLQMPKLGRTYSDAAQDELYNPEPATAPSYKKNDSFPRIFQEAQQQHQQQQQHHHHHHDFQSGNRERSPFRHSSPFYPTNSALPAGIDQNQQLALALALQDRMQKEAERSVAPKTISPRDSLLEYQEPESHSQMALFPPLQDRHDDVISNGGSLHASSHDGSDLDDFQSMATSRRESMANSSVSSHLEVPRFTGYMQQQQPQFDALSANPYYYADSSMQMHQPAAASYVKEDLSTNIPRPLDTSANTGTYTCTYSGCGQRFTTSTKLQKHRREAHRKSVPSGNSVSSAAAIASRNAQPGPHRCMRVNPSTGKPCNTVFSRPYDLTRHEDTIHNTAKAKVRCEICDDDKFFSRSDALVRHRRVKHGIH